MVNLMFSKLRDATDDFKVAKKFGKNNYIDKIIGFVYSNNMKFRKTENIKGPAFQLTL